ncbi:collagenase [Fulvivirga ulvae]|uniref:GEVED domain-containing protein n=1 Tax=Fulvivirga ulvae TaxID=2904245 RepID=UPI001F18BF42|nr:GEVED domain-containing protein [Fulvivirga ulvae]UII32119.1 collagenase [Fulvivirga ulvae]
MLPHKSKFLLFALLLLAQTYSKGQMQPPRTLQDHNDDYCSRMHTANSHKKNNHKKVPGPAYDRSVLSPYEIVQAACPTDAAGWAALSTSELVDQLKASDYACFGSFFNVESTYAPGIFSNANMQAVASAMYNLSVSYDGTRASGLYGLVYYLHAASYQDFYNDAVSMNATTTDSYIMACEALTDNPNLFLLTEDALDILDEYLILLDFPGLRHKASVLNVVKRVMTDLVINKVWQSLPDELLRTYSRACNRVFFLMFRGMQDDAYINAVDGDAEYFDLIYTISSSTELQNNDEFNYITENAAAEIARAAESPLLIDDVEGHLVSIINNSPRLSPGWLKAIEALNEYGNCAAYSLCENIEDLKVELNEMLFPNSYTFDDGDIRIRTPLDENEIQGLYHAAKQSQSQFFRMLQTDEPVAGDVNEVLNIVVFGSKQQYEDYATYLFNIATNNGGMYIERGATFYTWDRTVGVESSLSLEALFRHEYTHYLQGRYLIPGYWGEGEIYNDSRLVWFEEGMAEFFAGSTETEGIKLLASNANNIANSQGEWPSLNTVLNSSYSSGNFYHYHYGNMVWYNFYINDFSKIKTLFELTRSNDVAGFDNMVNQMRSNDEAGFTSFLTDVANGTVEGWEPETSWLNDDYLAIGSVADIESEFIGITNLTSAAASLDATAMNRRFRIDATITGSGSVSNNADAARSVEDALDGILLNLRENPLLNNFSYSIGYFKNLTYNSGTPTADIVILGPLKDANIPDTPQPEFSAMNTEAIAGGEVRFNNLSNGYIKSLVWSFPGGSPSSIENETNPVITYNNPGTYDVTLNVTGNDGAYSKSKASYITIYEKSDLTYCSASGSRDDNYINRLKFGSLDNPSGYQNYSDFTNQITRLTPGTSETLTIGTKNSYWSGNAVGAWIDWNADGDFDDTGEEVFNLYGAGPYETAVNVPSDAVLGVTTLRIRVGYGSADKIVACGDDTYIGEVEDYSIVISEESSSAPAAAFSASKTTIAAGESISFTDQSSNTPTTWAWTFPGGTPASSNAQNPVVNYTTPGIYDVTLTASNANGSDTKTVTGYITVEAASGYCASSSERAAYEYIANVEIEEFSNPSDSSKYSDFTHLTTTLRLGNNNITLTPGFLDVSFDEYFRVWVDFNQDGDFDDNGELAFDAGSASSSAVTGTITVPETALTGTTRMRVSMQFATAPEACGLIGDGEVEDYSVEILENPIPEAPSALTAELTSFTAITLSWEDNSDNEDGFEIERMAAGGAFEPIGTVTSDITNYADAGLDSNTTYTYRVRAKNGDAFSGYSNTSSATTPDLIHCAADNNTSASEQHISKVAIGTINNNSSHNATGYSDFTDQSTNIASVAELAVTPNQTTAETKAKAWVDWNRDGDFDDLGEEVLSAGGAGDVYNSVITVPAGTEAGEVVLRIRVARGATPTACGSIALSEVEDYTLNVEDVVSSTKFGETVSQENVNLYPNPSRQSQFYLSYPERAGDLEVTVTSMQGTVIHRQQILSQNPNHEAFAIKINQPVSGIYLVHIKGKAETIVKKIHFE